MVFIEKLLFLYEKQWKWPQGLITDPYGVPPTPPKSIVASPGSARQMIDLGGTPHTFELPLHMLLPQAHQNCCQQLNK